MLTREDLEDRNHCEDLARRLTNKLKFQIDEKVRKMQAKELAKQNKEKILKKALINQSLDTV